MTARSAGALASHVGVEQQQAGLGRRRRARAGRAAAPPGSGTEIEHRRPVGGEHRRHRQQRGVELDELLLLRAARGQQLAEVAVAVEEADADDRHAEVAGRLEVVAGEDAEAARVLGQRLAEAELGREVGDGAGAHRAASRTSRGRPGARPAGPRRRRGASRKPPSSAASSASRAGEAPASIPTGLPEALSRPPGSTSASTDAIWGSHVQARLRARRSSGSRPSGSGTLVEWSGGGVMASLPGVVQRASWKRFAARAAWRG